MHCKVLTVSLSAFTGGGLTYDSGNLKVQKGSHVLVPIRKQLVEGVVIDVIERQSEDEYNIRKIESLLSDEPLLSRAQIKTLNWISEYYFCTPRQALRAWLPSPPWNNLRPSSEIYYKLIDPSVPKRSVNQQMIAEYLRGKGWVSFRQLKNDIRAQKTMLESLVLKGRAAKTNREETFEKFDSGAITKPALTPEQTEVYEKIKGSPKPSVLFGVTSSGKTEIYAKLIADAAQSGKQSILLVPEILLTENCVSRFEELIGKENIAVVHSRLTPSQKRKAWVRVHNGGVMLVIGSRSALFAPFRNLGLVIIDEEHEWTYKNEQAPRYSARETAQKLCEFSGAKLVLGTATPSLESWSRAKSGEYQLVKLMKRWMDSALPKVRIIDLAEVSFGKLYPFSLPLLTAIHDRLQKGEQSILFLNRRGSASAMMCLDCRRRIVSPVSNLPFTVHKDGNGNPYLLDHTCGLRAQVPVLCPFCKSAKLLEVGTGTQKIEDLLKNQFPSARILRADSDTLESPAQMRMLLNKMKNGTADILLGTQSVVKGLDLPNVTLAGVLIADIGLSLPHFRAGERIFQLLTQLAGRSGRAKPGEVIIQTFRPGAPEINLAAEHKTEEFLNGELKLRIHSGYPPASKMIRLIIRENARTRANELCKKIETISDNNYLNLKTSASPLIFSGGKTWQVLVMGADPSKAVQQINIAGISVDVDPVECV